MYIRRSYNEAFQEYIHKINPHQEANVHLFCRSEAVVTNNFAY